VLAGTARSRQEQGSHDMKQTVCGLLIVLFLVTMVLLRWGPVWWWGGGQYSFDRQGETATVHRDGDILADVENVEVQNSYGKVLVEVADGIPGWSWDLTCWAKTVETAEYFAEQIEMRVDQQPGRSSWTLVLPNAPSPELRGVDSKLTLRVPASAKVHVRNRYGDSEIAGVQGETLARCQYGKLELTGLGGIVDAETSYAPLNAKQIRGGKLSNTHHSITATDVEGDLETLSRYGEVNVQRVAGNLKVNSQFGKVTVSKIAGPLEIEAYHADVQLDDIDGNSRVRTRHGRLSGQRLRGNVDARNEYNTIDLDVNCAKVVCNNQHGKIELHLADPKLRLVRAETAFADLELSVSESLSPKIEAQSRNGSIKSELPVYAMETGTDNFQGLDASVPRVTLKNEYGSIRIRKSAQGSSGG
jgi:DUF4097 and DUF4098 domain-containing protein YvlB